MEAETPKPIAELEHGPSKFEQFLENNQKLLLGGSIAIFLGVLGYVGYTSYSDMVHVNAGKAVVEAQTSDDLLKAIKDNAKSPSAASAAILLAQLAPDQTIDQLKSVIELSPDSPAAPIAATKLGLALLKDNKLDEAKAQLSAVLDMKNADFISPAAKLGLADIAKQQGDLDQAKKIYTEISQLGQNSIADINKFSGFVNLANARLQILGVSTPKEIPAPAKDPKDIPAPPKPADQADTPPPASLTLPNDATAPLPTPE